MMQYVIPIDIERTYPAREERLIDSMMQRKAPKQAEAKKRLLVFFFVANIKGQINAPKIPTNVFKTLGCPIMEMR